MGILRNGIFGGFEKRTGGVIGRTFKGRNVVSAPPHAMVQALTELQKKQRVSFKLVSEFLSTFVNLIRIGFAHNKRFFPMNLAMQYNFKTIVGGVYPDYFIRYEKVIYSKGSLCGPDSPTVVSDGNGLLFSWQFLEQNRFNMFNDQVCVLAYSPAAKLSATAAYAAGRSDLSYRLVLPSAFAGDLLHCYMSFVSQNGKLMSDSVYLGEIQN